MDDSPQTSLTSRAAVGASWLVAFRMFTRTLGVISTLVLARLLVPSDFGLIAIATAFANGIDALSQVGVQNALLRRADDSTALYNTAFTLQAARGLLTACIIAGGAQPVAHWFGEPRLVPVMLVLSLSTGLMGLENIAVVEFRRDIRYHNQFILQAVPRIVSFLVTVIIAFIFRNYWALICGIATSQAVRLVMSYYQRPFRPKLSLKHWRELAGVSFWLWLTSLACLVWDRCDPFIIGPAVGAAKLGVFLLALEVATLPITELIAPAADVLLASFSAAHRKGTELFSIAMPVMLTLFLAVIPVAITISEGAGLVVSGLLGPRWREAESLVHVLALISIAAPFAWVGTSLLVACGNVRYNFFANLCASVMKVSVLVLATHLTARLQSLALAATGVMFIESAIFLSTLRRAAGAEFSVLWRPTIRITGAGCLAACPAYFTGLGEPSPATNSFLALLQFGVLGVVVSSTYLLAVYIFWTAAGRPDGPETRVALIVRSLYQTSLKGLLSSRRANHA